MKLKSRGTGVIGELHYEPEKEYPFTVATGDALTTRIYKKLAHLYAEWTDYEESEEFYYINECGDVCKYKYDGGCASPILEAKEIGNSFETEEKAEKAVEQLKALKRLKDKGFKFTGCSLESDKGMCICYKTDIETWSMQDLQDFKRLFGGEE